MEIISRGQHEALIRFFNRDHIKNSSYFLFERTQILCKVFFFDLGHFSFAAQCYVIKQISHSNTQLTAQRKILYKYTKTIEQDKLQTKYEDCPLCYRGWISTCSKMFNLLLL